MKEEVYQKITSTLAIFAGLSILAYAYSFIVARDPFFYSLFLMLSGLLSLEVIVALYPRLKKVHEGYALIAVFLGALGSLGMFIHGGYDLAGAINPPPGIVAAAASQIDPRGLLSFGLTGLAIIKISYLLQKGKDFPKGLSLLGFFSGLLLIVIYLGRLIIVDPANPVLLYPVLIEGFVVNPVWYIWLGLAIWQSGRK